MKTAHLAPIALLISVGCSPPSTTDSTTTKVAAAPGDPAPAAAHAGAHSGPMDMATMTPAAGDSVATRGYKRSMSRMMEGMPPYTGDADVDFNKQMRVHHLAAIDMAEVQLEQGRDAESRALATKIIADQKREVAQIDAWLAKRGR